MFSVRLKELRKLHNLTQRQVADGIGVKEVTLQRFEYGTVRPSLDTLLALADYFDVSLNYLVGRSENEYDIEVKSVDVPYNGDTIIDDDFRINIEFTKQRRRAAGVLLARVDFEVVDDDDDDNPYCNSYIVVDININGIDSDDEYLKSKIEVGFMELPDMALHAFERKVSDIILSNVNVKKLLMTLSDTSDEKLAFPVRPVTNCTVGRAKL